MTGQDENPKPADQAVNRHKIINDDPEARDRNLQAFLNNGNFKAALTAHRVFDMQRHVGNLYKWFPDFQPPSDVLRELIEAGDKGGQFRLDQDQLRQVGKRMEQGKDYVKNAWLFVGTREVVVGYYYGIRAGHVIRDVISKQEQDQRMHGEDFMEAALSIEAPLAEESFKGMFARFT
ncbi:MAG: hypothetical protein HYV40_02050 [Candidatus Levybacteria bacterium]|nr:hypothetical protein [Candidatus Levybacteria bacterium]